jgi:hypothetical protein
MEQLATCESINSSTIKLKEKFLGFMLQVSNELCMHHTGHHGKQSALSILMETSPALPVADGAVSNL